jgi:hypothetical protein
MVGMAIFARVQRRAFCHIDRNIRYNWLIRMKKKGEPPVGAHYPQGKPEEQYE